MYADEAGILYRINDNFVRVVNFFSLCSQNTDVLFIDLERAFFSIKCKKSILSFSMSAANVTVSKGESPS